MADSGSMVRCTQVLRSLGLLGAADGAVVEAIEAWSFAFADLVLRASSRHLHVKVDAVAGLPRQQLEERGWRVTLDRAGFVEFAAAPGVTVSFSSVAVSDDDGADTCPRPFLDHVGFDFTEAAGLPRMICERAAAI